MAKRKFSKKEFKAWLDCIAKVTCKTDDNFTCQIRLSGDCAGAMMPLDYNCQWCHIKRKKSYNVRWLAENAITGCGQCHTYAHDNPDEFIKWFEKNYSHRFEVIDRHNIKPSKVWKESDFRLIEKELLQEALAVGVDYINVPLRYRVRLKRKLEELKIAKCRKENDSEIAQNCSN